MIISEEQVRLAVEYLQTTERGDAQHVTGCGSEPVSPELLEKIRLSLEGTPDLRDDRVAHGRMLLGGHEPSGSEVAEKMIGRIISDSIR